VSEQTTRLLLTTQPSQVWLSLAHYSNADVRLSKLASTNLVTGLVLPSGDIVDNPVQSDENLFEPVGNATTESITLLTKKAERLVRLFARLKPDHGLQCHDLVEEVEGWSYDRGLGLQHKVIQPANFVGEYEDVISGNPYTIQIVRGTPSEPDFGCSHSCYGTDEGRLLGIVGLNLPLTTMDPETARDIYANGAAISFLAKTLLPSE
jgi:hypothetical protein